MGLKGTAFLELESIHLCFEVRDLCTISACYPLASFFVCSYKISFRQPSDLAQVICLDDYHTNDRAGRKATGLTVPGQQLWNTNLPLGCRVVGFEVFVAPSFGSRRLT